MRKLTLLTDHKPLVWFQNSKDPYSRVSRWRLKLAEYDFDVVYKAGKMNVNADALSRNPIANEEKSRNLHEDDDNAFMTSQGKAIIEKTFIKVNQENNIKKGNNSKSDYFNSIFTQDDTDDLSESSKDTILNINPKFPETSNVSPNAELFNHICNNFLKYTSLLKFLASKLLL